MNQTTKRFLAIGAIIVLTSPALSSAQRDRSDESPQRRRSGDKRSGTQRRQRSGDGSSRQRITQVKKLQGLMKDELKLSRAQTESIDGLFREHLRSKAEGKSRSRSAERNGGDQAELDSLRDQMLEARRNGDTEKAAELRKQFRGARRARSPGIDSETAAFLGQLEGKLSEEQTEAFRGLLERTGLRESSERGRRGGGGLLALRRAVMSPEVGLSNEQREAIQGIMQGAMSSFSPGDRESGRNAGAMEKVRAEIMAQLTPEQRGKAEAAMKAERGSRGGGNRSREGDRDQGRRRSGNRDRSERTPSTPTDEAEDSPADTEPADDEP